MISESRERAARRSFAVALALLLFYSVLTLWVRERWALSVLQGGAFLLGIAWAALSFLRPVSVRRSFLLIPLAGTVLWGLVQLALGTTVYRFETWNAVLHWTTILVLVFVALQVSADPEIRHALLRAMLYFGFSLSVVAITQYFTSAGKIFWIFPSGYPDALGPFVYRNNYAAFVELLLPLAVVEALRDRRRALLFTFMAAVFFASVIASASRAGSILVTMEIFAVLPLAIHRGLISRRQAATGLVKICALAAVLTAVVGWRVLWQRLQQPDPFLHRREMLASSLSMARERPWFGFGLGTFETAYPAYALFDIGLIVNHAHNDWAEWLAEGGIPLLVMVLAIALWSVRPALRSLWGIGLLSVFVHALVDYPMQRLGLAAWIFVTAGILAARESAQPPRRSTHAL